MAGTQENRAERDTLSPSFLKPYFAVQRLLLEGCIVVLAVLVTAEVVCRSFFGVSLYVVEEIGGYLLVAIVFLGMPITLADGTLFRVEYLIESLSHRGQLVLMLFYNLLSLAGVIVLDWQLIKLVIDSFNRAVTAPTILRTPLYLPQMIMVIGMTSVGIVLLLQIIRGLSQLRAGERDE